VLTGSSDKAVQLWSAADGKELTPPLRHQGLVKAVAFSPDGKAVLTGSDDKTARLWDAATGQELTPPLRHQEEVRAVAFSPDGKIVLTGSWDGTARLWSAVTGQPIGEPLRHQGAVWVVTFSPDGKAVLTGGGGFIKKSLNTWGEARLWSALPARIGQVVGKTLRHQGAVLAVACSRDGKVVLTGSADKTARLWDMATGQPRGQPLRHQGPVWAVAFSPNRKTVVTGSADKTARLWDAATGEAVGETMHHQDRVDAVAFSPDGKTILTGSADQTARLWSAATGQPRGQPLRHQSSVNAVAFSPDGKTILTGSGWDARLWSAATGQPIGEPLSHQRGVWAVTFSPDGKTILTGGVNKARLWSAATGQPLGETMRHQGIVKGVAFSPDGKTVLTGSWDGTARLWSAVTGQPLGQPLRHWGAVNAVAFTLDNKTALTGSAEMTAQVWRIPVVFKGNAKRMKLLTQVVTGTEMDDRGGLHGLDPKTWHRLRKQQRQLGETSITREEDAQDWHRREAIEADLARQWFAGAWHLGRLIDATPTDGQLWKARAKANALLGQWEKASADFGKASQLSKSDFETWALHGMLRLYLADEKGYRQACTTLVKRWGAAQDLRIRYYVARICALAPNAVADLKPFLQLAEQLVEQVPNDPNFHTTLGAMLFRAGRTEEAAKRFTEAIAKTPGKKGSAWDWLFLAMAQQKLGHPEEAKSCLAKGGKFLKPQEASWSQRLGYQILHREAEALVKGTKR
jgi:WD40 repeat protein